MNPFITIDNYKFTLIGKLNERHYWYVYIFSEHIADPTDKTNFWVYPSNSELGLWRLSATSENIKYKGQFVSAFERRTRDPTVQYFYYDYVQQTCIYIELQVFINQHFGNLKTVAAPLSLMTPNKPHDPKSRISFADNEKIFNLIDNHDRQIQLSPFILLQQIIECGEVETVTPRRRPPDVVIKEFSQQLEIEYDLLYENIEIIAPYNKVFQDMIDINGNIMRFPLKNKRTNEIVMLYACVVKMTEIQTVSAFRNSRENITRICGKDLHIMPFFLTTADSSINCFGTYTKYIPCGAFICKLFDYSDGYHKLSGYKQCTPTEFARNHCTSTYSYIGDRYDNIFPFNEWIDKTNYILNKPWSRKLGVRSATSKQRISIKKRKSV